MRFFDGACMAFVFRAKGVSALHGFRTRDSMPRVPPWVSLLRLFLFCVMIQRSPPSPFDAGSRQIPRDADKRGESLKCDERNRPPGWAVRREEPAPDDEPEDRQSGSPEDGRPGQRRPPFVGCCIGLHVAPRSITAGFGLLILVRISPSFWSLGVPPSESLGVDSAIAES